MLLIFGTKESSLVNTVVTVIHVVLVVFIIVAGGCRTGWQDFGD